MDIRTTPILEVLKQALQQKPKLVAEFLVTVRNIAAKEGLTIATLSTDPGTVLDWEEELAYVESLTFSL